jgi:hypothetical protein
MPDPHEVPYSADQIDTALGKAVNAVTGSLDSSGNFPTSATVEAAISAVASDVSDNATDIGALDTRVTTLEGGEKYYTPTERVFAFFGDGSSSSGTGVVDVLDDGTGDHGYLLRSGDSSAVSETSGVFTLGAGTWEITLNVHISYIGNDGSPAQVLYLRKDSSNYLQLDNGYDNNNVYALQKLRLTEASSFTLDFYWTRGDNADIVLSSAQPHSYAILFEKLT